MNNGGRSVPWFPNTKPQSLLADAVTTLSRHLLLYHLSVPVIPVPARLTMPFGAAIDGKSKAAIP